MILLRDPLSRAWLALVLLSGAVTLLARHGGRAVGAMILLAAAIKARLIVRRYMRLAGVPGWGRGFDLVLGLLCALLLGLYLAG